MFARVDGMKLHRRAKLTERAVREIRRRHSVGESQRSISKRFKVSQPTIGQVVQRATWRHVK